MVKGDGTLSELTNVWPNDGSTYPAADHLCIEYCDTYWDVCKAQNGYFNPPSPRGGDRRNLIAGVEPPLPRMDNYDLASAYENCLSACMQYPRPFPPSQYTEPLLFGSNLGSDTLWCRLRHLSLGAGCVDPQGRRTPSNPVFHCPHASPAGGGICREILVDGYTPHEHWRQGATTARRLGYCDVSADDRVADCTKSSINDGNIGIALSLIPASVEFIFMNDNRGITHISSETFDNLQCPECVKSLFMEECNVGHLDPDAFSPLINLEILYLNENPISEYPSGIFYNNPRLREYSHFRGDNYETGQVLRSLPADLFRFNKELERLQMYDHTGLQRFPPGIFDGLTKLEIISFVGCGFVDGGFPPGVFRDLESLMFFDFFGNQFSRVEASWFEGGWGSNIIRLALDRNVNLVHVDANAFDTLESLEICYLHDCPLDDIPPGLFDNNHNLISFTLGRTVNPDPEDTSISCEHVP